MIARCFQPAFTRLFLAALVLVADLAVSGETPAIAEHDEKLLLLLTRQAGSINRPDDKWIEQNLINPLVSDSRIHKVVFSQPYCPNENNDNTQCNEDATIKLLIDIYAPAYALADISSSVIATQPEIPFAVYRVRERQPRSYTRTWPLGEASPGVRMVALMVKRDKLTLEEFDAYWRDKHTPIALAQPIGVWNYLQNIVIACEGACEEIHGIALEQFRNATDLPDRFKKTPWSAFKGIWSARKFMDLSSNRSQLMVERVLKDREHSTVEQ